MILVGRPSADSIRGAKLQRKKCVKLSTRCPSTSHATYPCYLHMSNLPHEKVNPGGMAAKVSASIGTASEGIAEAACPPSCSGEIARRGSQTGKSLSRLLSIQRVGRKHIRFNYRGSLQRRAAMTRLLSLLGLGAPVLETHPMLQVSLLYAKTCHNC